MTPPVLRDLPELPDFGVSMDLLYRAQHGDNDALNDLLARYQERLHRIVRIQLGSRLRRRYESMDFVQEAFRAALPKLAELKPRNNATLLQWLALIALNRIRDADDRESGGKRNMDLEVEIDADDSPGGHRERLEAGGSLPEAKALKREVRKMLDEAISRLPDAQRRVVLLRDYIGADWSDIALELKRPTVHAARQLHQHAWIKLRRELGPKLE